MKAKRINLVFAIMALIIAMTGCNSAVQISDVHIFLDNTVLYNSNGEDITTTIDTSSGGV